MRKQKKSSKVAYVYRIYICFSFKRSISYCVSSQTVCVFLEDEDSEDSSSDVEVKKRGRRHKLLRHKLSLSEGESGDEKAASKEKKGGKKKSKG